MKTLLFSSVCFLVACGTPKHEEKLPRDTPMRASEQPEPAVTNPNSLPAGEPIVRSAALPHSAPAGEPLVQDTAAAVAQTAEPQEQQFYIKGLESFANPQRNAEGTLVEEHGACLTNVLVTGNAIELSLPALAPSAADMGSRAACEVNIDVTYRAGWTFAISRVSLPIRVDIKPGMAGVVAGRYSFDQSEGLHLETAVGPEYNRQSLLIERPTAAAEREWAPCSGRSQLRLSTSLGMNAVLNELSLASWEATAARAAASEADPGSIELRSDAPYRFEIVWKACPITAQ